MLERKSALAQKVNFAALTNLFSATPLRNEPHESEAPTPPVVSTQIATEEEQQSAPPEDEFSGLDFETLRQRIRQDMLDEENGSVQW